MPLPDGWVVGDLLVEDTFTRPDGSLGSTEGGTLGPLAWSVTGTGVAVASNAAQANGTSDGRAVLTITGRPRIRIEATIDASFPSSFSASYMTIVARGNVHNQMQRVAVTGYRPRLNPGTGARPAYTAASAPTGTMRLDLIDTQVWASYEANIGPTGSGEDGPVTFTPVDWTIGLHWDLNNSGDVARWLDFRVWELKPKGGGWQLGSVGWGAA